MVVGQYAMILIIGWQTYTIARESGMDAFGASGQLALIGLLQFLRLHGLLVPQQAPLQPAASEISKSEIFGKQKI